jgi:outer membrane protein OmpA-like peptidoglycan-associated protein
MIRWLTSLVLIGAVALSTSGCFYLGGNFETHITPVSKRLSTTSEIIPVPGTDVVTVDVNLNGSMLAIEAQLKRECRPTTFETWQNYDKHIESLPWGHWLMLTGGLLTAGGGGTALALGVIDSQTVTAGAVHEASTEVARDRGNIMMIAGAAAAALGVMLLTSEVIDAATLNDTRVATDVVIKPIQGPQEPCEDGPAKGHLISIETLPSGEQLTQRVTLVTDDFGRAAIDLKDPKFDNFPYGDPFALIHCEHCTGWNLTLLPDSAAALAIHRRDHEALTSWAETYGAQSDPVVAKRVKEAKSRRDVVALGDAITFTTGSSKLRRDANKHLDQAAEFLLKRRNLQLRIEGHTDSTGNEAKNRELSRRRAETVKRYLVQRGVPSDRLITVGMAASRPVESNRSQAGRKANRRYQFQLLED